MKVKNKVFPPPKPPMSLVLYPKKCPNTVRSMLPSLNNNPISNNQNFLAREASVSPPKSPRTINLNSRPHWGAYKPKRQSEYPTLQNAPLTYLEVLNTPEYCSLLTEREKIEIQSKNEIYYIRQKHPNNNSNNENTEQDLEYFNFVKNDHIDFRYQQISKLGKGAFGIVIKCYDHKYHRLVAVKLVHDIPCMHKQILLEKETLSTLKSLGDIPTQHHLVQVFDLFELKVYGDKIKTEKNDLISNKEKHSSHSQRSGRIDIDNDDSNSKELSCLPDIHKDGTKNEQTDSKQVENQISTNDINVDNLNNENTDKSNQSIITLMPKNKRREQNPNFFKSNDNRSHDSLQVIATYHVFVMELLSTDLEKGLKNNKGHSIELSKFPLITRQIADAIGYLHSLGFIHCDIKPENVIWSSVRRTNIKLTDFGCCCKIDHTLFEYVQTRYYRSPEIILGLSYGPEVDVWSFGCLIPELYTSKVLFKGEDEFEMMQLFMSVLGEPPASFYEKGTQKSCYFDDNNMPIVRPNSKGVIHPISSKSIAGILMQEAQNDPNVKGLIELVELCLKWVPSERITMKELLLHPWVSRMRVKPPPSAPAAPRARSMKTARQDPDVPDNRRKLMKSARH